MEPAFAKAEALVSAYFEKRVDDPTQGTIEISGERYVLVRASALSVEFFTLVEDLYGPDRTDEADVFARNILFDLAHSLGRSDAREFERKMKVKDPLDRLSAGPIAFAHSGWASVSIFPESNPTPTSDFFLFYDHPYSFEAEAWLRSMGRGSRTRRAKALRSAKRRQPVCIMNAGYSSGWCEAAYEMSLVATEVLCRARGDEACRFIMAPPDRIEEHLDRFIKGRKRSSGNAPALEIPDFFARKRMEEELRKAHGELELRVHDRTQELLRANDLLKRQMVEREKIAKQLRQAHKLEAIGRLSGGIAHDFNNLLAIFMTRGGLLQRRLKNALPDGDPALVDLTEMLRAGERAAALTAQLLAFSRGQVLSRERIDFNVVARELAKTLVPLIGADIELELDIDTGPAPIRADRGQIEQVIMNLVVNARDAMPSGGTLSFSTGIVNVGRDFRTLTGELRPRRYVVLSIADAGMGMDEETQSKMFDPFFTTKPEGKGTGLGLATVYGIVQQCDGGISVESTPGAGTTFRVYLPVDGDGESAVMEAPRSTRDVETGSETLLLVEDETELRLAVAEILADYGYHVVATPGPLEALKLLDEPDRHVDVLVTDLVMPKMSGVELARRVLAARPEVRVLFVSGYAPEGAERETMLVDKRASFLGKPFQPDDLLRKLRNLLDR